jgi:hypothetical protein
MTLFIIKLLVFGFCSYFSHFVWILFVFFSFCLDLFVCFSFYYLAVLLYNDVKQLYDNPQKSGFPQLQSWLVV